MSVDSKDDILTVYSLPVSGGCFVSQLALLSELYNAKKKICGGKFNSSADYTPDLCFSASGGNVAVYTAFGGDWSTEGILRVSSQLNSDMFVKSWFPDYMRFLPTGILGIFNGSLYRPGYGGLYLFNRIFTEESIQNVEIWTGTYNVSTNQAEFFCNKSRERSLIQQEFFENDSELYNVLPLRYVSDESKSLEILAKVAMASASIPYIVQNQKIGNHLYGDGGTMYSSPTLPLSNELYRLVKGYKYKKENYIDKDGIITQNEDSLNSRRLRHFYFSPYDTNSPEVIMTSITINGSITQILHTNLLQDRASSISNLQHIYGVERSQLTYEHHIDMSEDGLAEILKMLENYDHYVCDLYPKGIPIVSLQKFSTKDIETTMNLVKKNYGVRVWYYSPKIIRKD